MLRYIPENMPITNELEIIQAYELAIKNYFAKKDEFSVKDITKLHRLFIALMDANRLGEVSAIYDLDLSRISDFWLLANHPLSLWLNSTISKIGNNNTEKSYYKQDIEEKIKEINNEPLVLSNGEYNVEYNIVDAKRKYEDIFNIPFKFFREFSKKERKGTFDAQNAYTDFRNFLALNPITDGKVIKEFCKSLRKYGNLDVIISQYYNSTLTMEDVLFRFYKTASNTVIDSICSYCKLPKTKDHYKRHSECKESSLGFEQFKYQGDSKDLLILKEPVRIFLLHPTLFELKLKKHLEKNLNTKKGTFIYEVELYPDLERRGDLRVIKQRRKSNLLEMDISEVYIDAKSSKYGGYLRSQLLDDSKIGSIDFVCVPDSLYRNRKSENNSAVQEKQNYRELMDGFSLAHKIVLEKDILDKVKEKLRKEK